MSESTTRTEYALDFGAGVMCASEDSADAAEMQQFVPDSRVVARTVTESEWEPVDQEPGPDLSLIPTSREEARPVEVNGVIATAWRDVDSGDVYQLWADVEGDPSYGRISNITSVRSVHVLADDKVAVPRELVERAKDKRAHYAGPLATSIVRDLAALDGDE